MNSEGKSVAQDGDDETLADRLRTLIGSRSIRAAAKAWQLSYSTLNNYIHRGTEPSLSIAMQIAELEGVSVEWLAQGDRADVSREILQQESVGYQPAHRDEEEPLLAAWTMVFRYLEREEQEALLRLIHQEGVKSILSESKLRGALACRLATLSTGQRRRFYQQAQALIDAIGQSGEPL